MNKVLEEAVLKERVNRMLDERVSRMSKNIDGLTDIIEDQLKINSMILERIEKLEQKEKLSIEMFEFFSEFYLWQVKVTPYFKFHDDKSGLSKRLKKIT